MSLLVHLALFLCISIPIVVLSVFFSEADDAKAVRVLPRRMLSFVVGCGVLAGIMLLCEATLASLG